MEFLRPILAKIELICQQPTMPQLSGVHHSSGVREGMAGGSRGGLVMKLHKDLQIWARWPWPWRYRFPITLQIKVNQVLWNVAKITVVLDTTFEVNPRKRNQIWQAENSFWIPHIICAIFNYDHAILLATNFNPLQCLVHASVNWAIP